MFDVCHDMVCRTPKLTQGILYVPRKRSETGGAHDLQLSRHTHHRSHPSSAASPLGNAWRWRSVGNKDGTVIGV